MLILSHMDAISSKAFLSTLSVLDIVLLLCLDNPKKKKLEFLIYNSNAGLIKILFEESIVYYMIKAKIWIISELF